MTNALMVVPEVGVKHRRLLISAEEFRYGQDRGFPVSMGNSRELFVAFSKLGVIEGGYLSRMIGVTESTWRDDFESGMSMYPGLLWNRFLKRGKDKLGYSRRWKNRSSTGRDANGKITWKMITGGYDALVVYEYVDIDEALIAYLKASISDPVMAARLSPLIVALEELFSHPVSDDSYNVMLKKKIKYLTDLDLEKCIAHGNDEYLKRCAERVSAIERRKAERGAS